MKGVLGDIKNFVNSILAVKHCITKVYLYYLLSLLYVFVKIQGRKKEKKMESQKRIVLLKRIADLRLEILKKEIVEIREMYDLEKLEKENVQCQLSESQEMERIKFLENIILIYFIYLFVYTLYFYVF